MTLGRDRLHHVRDLVTEASLASTTDPQEELAVLEAQIQGASQVTVDIYSRYLFERKSSNAAPC